MKPIRPILPLLALASCAGQPAAERPNIIVILADDLGCGDLSALGCEVLQTPEIDRLCAEGLNLTNGYAAAPTSTPSRYALLTGLYPWRNRDAEVLTGDANSLIADGQPTLAGMLRQAGYATGAVGKWHLGSGARADRLEPSDRALPGRCRVRLLVHHGRHRRSHPDRLC